MRFLMSFAVAFIVTFAALFSVASAIEVQQRASTQVERAAPDREQAREPARRAPVQRAEGRLNPTYQRALETGDTALLLSMISQAHAHSQSPAGGQLDLQADTSQGYICNGGNCACAGASDCLEMFDADACVEGTLGCNDYGCTCEGTEGAEGTQN
ncbi:MAG: hypothetical protein AAFX09_10160 [Pseudomonadota bacterium]